MRIFIFITLMLMSALSSAAVYKCVKPEGTVYSEQPCDNNSKLLKTQKPSDEEVTSAQEKLKKYSQSNKISIIEKEIVGYKEDMDRELAALRNQQSDANNNLAGATWLQSISTEMSAVTSKYQLKIQDAQHRLDSLKSTK